MDLLTPRERAEWMAWFSVRAERMERAVDRGDTNAGGGMLTQPNDIKRALTMMASGSGGDA